MEQKPSFMFRSAPYGALLSVLLSMSVASAHAQTKFPYIASTGQISVSAAAYAATLQQPATATTSSLPVSFPVSTTGGAPPAGASVYCSVACVATITRNGTAATATAGTVTAVNPTDPVPVVNFFTGSNASGGVTLGIFNIPAGSLQVLDMSAIKMGAGGTAVNLTISIASLTGTVNITFYPLEQH